MQPLMFAGKLELDVEKRGAVGPRAGLNVVFSTRSSRVRYTSSTFTLGRQPHQCCQQYIVCVQFLLIACAEYRGGSIYILEGVMASDEPSLPGLPGVSWDEQSQTFSNNPRKRRQAQQSNLAYNSSDPAVFSSDDDPALDNYVEGRRKRRYVGTWYQQDPASSDSGFGEPSARPATKTKRTLARQLDSGVFLGSDSTDSDDLMECPEVPSRPRLAQLVVPRISDAEQLLRTKIRSCMDSGEETIDFWSNDLEELSNETVAPLSQFSCIPTVTKDVAFEQKDPQLKLYLAANRLSRIPGALFDITHLTILSLRGNQLEEIPQSISKLINLKELNISQNRLRHLPVELFSLMETGSKLETLTIHPNPFFQPDVTFGGFYAEDTLQKPEPTPNSKPGTPKYALSYKPPRFLCRRLGRSRVEEYDCRGDNPSKFTNADAPKRLPVDLVFDKAHYSTWWYPANHFKQCDPRRGFTRVPNLIEAALRSCSKSTHLSELEHYVNEELPHLQRLLHRASRQKAIGGVSCSECKTCIVTPALEWIEWRDLRSVKPQPGNLAHRMSPLSELLSEMAVPFLHRACSRRCGPLRERSHWETKDQTDGSTEATRYYNF
jgi:hypothetical protein